MVMMYKGLMYRILGGRSPAQLQSIIEKDYMSIRAEEIPTKEPGILEETKDLTLDMISEIGMIMRKDGNLLAKGMVVTFFGMLFIMIGILIYASK